jgi:glycosyltransferase involved in cell wall biosynthesis
MKRCASLDEPPVKGGFTRSSRTLRPQFIGLCTISSKAMIASPPPPARPHLAIALVTETYPPEINGVAMTLSRLVTGLAERGHEVQVVRPRQPGAATGTLVPSHPRVRELVRPGLAIPGYTALRLGLPSTQVLIRSWRERRPDIVHVATEGPLGASALSAAETLGIPLSSSYHTNFDDYAKHYRIGLLRGTVERWLRSFHNRTGVTMVPSADVVRRLETAGYSNCALWSRGVDITLFDPERRDQALRAHWGVADGDLVCLHVGRVAPEKDIPLALRAFAAIRAIHPRARMVVAGDGPLRAELARKHPEVLFTGVLPVADLAAAYASADIFLFPSLSETFGNVLCEAMASGLAAVGFDYAAARMHVVDGVNALKVDCGEDEAFIAAALRLAGDPVLRAKLGSGGRTTMHANAWGVVVDRFEDLLHRVIAAERTRGLELLCTS